jgi:hypothetical protein
MKWLISNQWPSCLVEVECEAISPGAFEPSQSHTALLTSSIVTGCSNSADCVRESLLNPSEPIRGLVEPGCLNRLEK